MIRGTSIAALAALALLAPRPAEAQIRLIPQVGLYSQFSKLPSASAGATEFKKSGTLAYGVALELGQPDKVSFRINALHATGSEVPVTQVGCQTDECVTSTVSSVTATLAVRPIPTLILIQPFLLLGGGVKRYDFTKEDLQNEGVTALWDSQNQLAGHVGVGVELNLGLVRLTGEISDLISQFDTEGDEGETDELQHDAFFTVGLVIGD